MVLSFLSNLLSGVWSLIKGVYDTIVSFIPFPIKICISIFILVNVLGVFEPLTLQLVGYHCNSKGDLYQLNPITDISENIRLIGYHNKFEIQSPIINSTHTLLTIPESCSDSDVSSCTNCSKEAGFWGRTFGIYNCTSDGYRLDESGDSFSSLQIKDCIGAGCTPPTGYYFNRNDNVYYCYDNNKCNNISTALDDELFKFNNANLVNIPTNSSEKFKIGNFISVDCESINPRFKIFHTIKLLDPKMWLLVLILVTVIVIKAINRL